MRFLKIFLCISLSLSIFASCQKNIEFNEEISKPMVVVHSFLSPDSVVSARVSLSRFFLNDTASFKTVDNADVAVIVNGILKEKMSLITQGQYQGTYKPIIGDVVKLVVKVPSMNEVSSQTGFCKAPVINLVDTTKVIQHANYSINENDTISLTTELKINYTLKFKDDANEKNYYQLVVRHREHVFNLIWGQSVEEVTDRYYFDFTDEIAGNNKSTNPITGTITSENTTSSNKYNVFSDELINGKTYSLTFSAIYWLYKRYSSDIHYLSGGIPEKIEVFVSLQSITKDYYYYLKSRSASGGDSFFSEPVQVKNNIVGGIGFLGSYTSSNVVEFDLK